MISRIIKPKINWLIIINLALAISFLLITLPATAVHRIFFTFGKVEVLRTDDSTENRVWMFLRRGELVNDEDLIRIPPRGLLRIKYNDQDLLPTLPGGQENKVVDLIRSAQERKRQSRNANQNLNGQPAIDVLPLENKLITNGTKKQVNVLETITEIELDQLRQQLSDLPSHIVAQFPSPTMNNQNGNYPSHNIYLAQLLYPFCTKVVIDQDIYSNFQKLGLLYAQILHHFKIPTQLNVNQSGDLQVVFDSGLIPSEWQKISANTTLVKSAPARLVDKDHIWLTIQFSPKCNFTTAWYLASQPNGHR